MKSTLRKIILVTISSVLTLVLATFAIIYLPNRLAKEVRIEAGALAVLDESLFIKTNDDGKFLDEVKQIDLAVPGDYKVKVKVGLMTYSSMLIINDTQTPKVKVKDIISALKREIMPEDFIAEAIDNTALRYDFILAPNPNELGLQQVKISVTDLGGNIVVRSSTVLVSQVKDKVTIEAGSPIPIIEDFLLEEKTNEVLKTNISKLDLVVGTYPVEIQMDDRILICELEVVDTVAPTATTVPVFAYVGDDVSAESFVKDIQDESKVVVSYKEVGSITNKEGTFNPTILLTDAGNNVSEYVGKIVVKQDTEAPVLSGAGLKDRTVYVDEAFNIKASVYARDNRDGNVNVSVDRNVNFAVEGSTVVTFSAKDRAGNIARKSITITVKKHPPFVSKASTNNAALDGYVDELFATLLHGDMSTYQITEALYRFGRSIRYQAGPLTSEWTSRALSTLQSRTGNCFGRMYAMEALYTRAGISNREQIQYNQEHSWNQVNIGSGWLNIDVGYGSAFLVSDAYLRDRALRYSSIDDDTWETQAPANGTVLVEYVESSTNQVLADSISLQSKVGDSYTTNTKNIEGYTLIETPSNWQGVFNNGTIKVVYKYQAD